MEVMLSFDRGEDVGKFERCDILHDMLEVSVDFCSVTIDPETVNFELATAVVINNFIQILVLDEEAVASLRMHEIFTEGDLDVRPF